MTFQVHDVSWERLISVQASGGQWVTRSIWMTPVRPCRTRRGVLWTMWATDMLSLSSARQQILKSGLR